MYLSIKKRGRYNTLLLCIYLPTNFSIPWSKYMMATRFDWWSWNHVITHHFLSIGRNQLLANTKLGVPRIENENWGTRLSSSSTVVVWRFTDLKKMIVTSLGITLFHTDFAISNFSPILGWNQKHWYINFFGLGICYRPETFQESMNLESKTYICNWKCYAILVNFLFCFKFLNFY